jgi:hypothetical protein
VHDSPGAHATPQLPQWLVSTCVETQRSPHTWRPAPQLHRPALHVAPIGHASLHAPQFARSVWRSTHESSQYVARASAQVHSPATHVLPVPHRRPHAPQLSLLLCTLRQLPPQSIVPRGHEQSPLMHSCPLAQRNPHAPQCSVESSGTGTPPQMRQSSTRPLQSSSRPLVQFSARGEAHPQTRASRPSGWTQPQPEGHDEDPAAQGAVQTERSLPGMRRQRPEAQSSVVRQGSPN